MKIIDKDGSTPASNVRVMIKWPRDAAIEEFGEANVSNEASWENRPWHEGVSDASGTAVIDVVVTALDGNRGSGPADYNWVSGRKHMIKLEQMGSEVEEGLLLMSDGESTDTTSYQIVVESVGRTDYVD